MFCPDIDEETLQLIIQIQLEDLENLQRCSKGKHRAGERLDSDVAIDAYKAELKAREQSASDRSMSQSIQTAICKDSRIISAFDKLEKQATCDREIALHFDRTGTPRRDTKAEDGEAKNDTTLLKKLSRLHVFTDAADEEILDQPESSIWAASRDDPEKYSKKTVCYICLRKFPSTSVVRCPCRHKCCQDCIQSLFQASLTDESLFPPRFCGQPIPIDSVRSFLTSKLIGEFRAKEIEFSTPNRTYCHQPMCSTFVPKEFIKNDVATCPRCRYKTCTLCKGAEHKSQDCGQDTAAQLLLKLVGENGWQRCFSCRRVVELDHGCNHMTCTCGAQFCYLCGLKWKTCTCEQWNKARLLAHANAIVDRDRRT